MTNSNVSRIEHVDPNPNFGRFASLAFELYGERMVTDFVQEVWAAMPTERKTVLAEQVGAQIEKQLLSAADRWNLVGLLGDELQTLFAETFAPRRAEIVAMIEQAINAFITEKVASKVKEMIEHETNRCVDQVKRAVLDRVRDGR